MKLCSANSTARGPALTWDALCTLTELQGWNHSWKILPFRWKSPGSPPLELIPSLPFYLQGNKVLVSSRDLLKDAEIFGLRTPLSHLTPGGHMHPAPLDWLMSSWELLLSNKSEGFEGKKDKWGSGCFLTKDRKAAHLVHRVNPSTWGRIWKEIQSLGFQSHPTDRLNWLRTKRSQLGELRWIPGKAEHSHGVC